MVGASFWKRARSASCLYIVVRCRSSDVTRRRSNAQTCSEEPLDVAVDRQPERQDLRAAGPDLGTLDRVVVEEDEAVEPKVQLLRQRADILRLGLPVDPPGDQVLALQDHVRPAVEDLEHVGLVVLAAQAEQEPLARQLHHEPLQGPSRPAGSRCPMTPSSPTTPFHRVLSQSRTTTLCGGLMQSVDFPGQDRPERGEERGRVGDVPELVPSRVVVIGDRIQVEVGGPEQAQPGDCLQLAGDPLLDPGEEGPRVPIVAAPRASRGRGRRSAAPSSGPPLLVPRRSGRPRSAPGTPARSWPARSSPGRDRTQSSSRTNTTLTPWRFCDSRLPGSSNCWKTWSYGANSTDGGEVQLAHPEAPGRPAPARP